jgi:hypothetical protein
MAIQILQDAMGLGQALPQIGASLGQGLQQRGQRRAEQAKLQQAQQRQARSGTILQQALGQLGPNASLQEVQGALAQAIQAGADPSIVNQFGQQFAPLVKEQARTQGAQSFFNQLFGGGAQASPAGRMPQGQNIIGEAQVSTPQGTESAGFDISQVPESQLVIASGAPYPEIANIAKTELQRRDLSQKRFESERKYQGELSTPFLKKIDEQRDSVRQKTSAVELMQNAIEQGNIGFFSKDNFANFLGKYGEGLRTAKGAQLLNAQKEFLLGNIQRAGSRPNQWIEQQISQMLARVGRSKEANLTVTEALKTETDLENQKIKITDELSERFRNDLGYVPANIGAQVDKQLAEYANEAQKKLAYRLRDLYETEQGIEKLSKDLNKKVLKGTPLTLNMAREFVKKFGSVEKAVENAEKIGYVIPTKDEWQRWQR